MRGSTTKQTTGVFSSFWAVLNPLPAVKILTGLSVMIASSPFLSNAQEPIRVPLPSGQSFLAGSRMLHGVEHETM